MNLVEITGSADGSDFSCVVNKANAGLGQTVRLTNPDLIEAPRQLLPDVGSKATPCSKAHFMCHLLWGLSAIEEQISNENQVSAVRVTCC